MNSTFSKLILKALLDNHWIPQTVYLSTGPHDIYLSYSYSISIYLSLINAIYPSTYHTIYELFAALPASSVGDTPLPVDSSTFTLLSIYILSTIHTYYLSVPARSFSCVPCCPLSETHCCPHSVFVCRCELAVNSLKQRKKAFNISLAFVVVKLQPIWPLVA